MDLKFMTIGSHCASLYIFGEDRIKGPVDNMDSKKGLSSIQAIFNKGGLEKEFFEVGEIEQPYCGNRRDENEIWFSTTNYFIVHNNFRDTTYRESLRNRIYTLNQYIKEVPLDKNKFLLYYINEKDIEPIENKMSNLFINGIDILKKNNVFDKVVFLMIKSLDRKWYHYKCNDIFNYTNKVIDMDITITDTKGNKKLFYQEINNLFCKTKLF